MSQNMLLYLLCTNRLASKEGPSGIYWAQWGSGMLNHYEELQDFAGKMYKGWTQGTLSELSWAFTMIRGSHTARSAF